MKDNKENDGTRTSPGLKPISPNKANTLVGRLNFLQSDNLDEHFEQIHNSHSVIQQQLSSLEANTKQTSLDLDQLYDRLRNNNQHLNKLLENIANYLEEVVTEGNATKHDISGIFSKLEEMGLNSSKSNAGLLSTILGAVNGLKDVLNTKDSKVELLLSQISKGVEQVVERNSKLELTISELIRSEIKNELKNILTSNNEIKENLSDLRKDLSSNKTADSGDLKQMLSDHFKETNSQIQNSNNSNIEKLLREMPDTHETLLEIKRSMDTKSLSKQIDQLTVSQNKFENSISKIHNETFIELISQKDGKNADVETKLDELNNKLEELNSINELSAKKQQLEVQYSALCKTYEQKYNALQLLQFDFQELDANVRESTPSNHEERLKKLNKVNNLHVAKMNGLLNFRQGHESSFPYKRIQSTPLDRQPLLLSHIQSIDETFTANNSDIDEL